MAPMASALGSVVNAKLESAGWSLIGSIYVASGPVNSLALNESVQCIHSLDQMSQYNVAYLCECSSLGCLMGAFVATFSDILNQHGVSGISDSMRTQESLIGP